MAKKHEMPGWFPFAVVASFFGILGAGAISKWRLSGDAPAPPPTPPPPQPGVLKGWIAGGYQR